VVGKVHRKRTSGTWSRSQGASRSHRKLTKACRHRRNLEKMERLGFEGEGRVKVCGVGVHAQLELLRVKSSKRLPGGDGDGWGWGGGGVGGWGGGGGGGGVGEGWLKGQGGRFLPTVSPSRSTTGAGAES